ncbi:MAG: VanZ family protein [Pyrinomonadaceae bacterium]|jgi:VanZ family protein|nr:VanZ family protein [Pyrinomonadaceae bacterium]
MIEKSKKSFWHGRLMRFVPLLLWVGVILYASSDNGSITHTSRFVRPLLEFLFPNSPEETLLIYHGYIRKLAHLTEYAILAFFASRVFWNSSKTILQKYWYLFAFGLVFLVASIDEYNQSFNINRTGSVYDVGLDCVGGLVMIAILTIYLRKTSHQQ